MLLSVTTIMDAVTVNVNRTSSVCDLSDCTGFSAHATWTGTPVGSLYLEGSLDGTNFQSLTTALDTTGINGWLVNYPNACFRAVRMRYVSTSGTGVMTINIGKKDV